MQILKRRHFLQGLTGTLLAASENARASFSTLTPKESIAFCFSSPKNDNGWTACHEQAAQTVSRQFSQLRFITLENIPYAISFTHLLQYLIAENVKMIFTNSNYNHFLEHVAEQACSVSFIECNGTRITPNLGWFYPTYWQIFYILGHAAALISKTSKIGFISAFPVPSNIACINAALLGARQANISTQIQTITINSWFNPKMTAQAANALCDNQCDILFNLTNSPTHLSIAEQRQVMAVLYNCPHPDIHSPALLTSIYCHFEQFYTNQIQNRINGQWHAKSHFLEFPDECDYLPFNKTIPPAIHEQSNLFRQQFLLNKKQFYGPIHDHHGVLRIPAGHKMQPLETYQWNWFIDGVISL